MVREKCNMFVLFEQRGNILNRLYNDFFKETKIVFRDFDIISTKVWGERYNYLVIDLSINKNINGKQ